MLGLLCTGTPKPWILSSHYSSAAVHHSYSGVSSSSASNSRLIRNSSSNPDDRRSFQAETAVSVWHANLPAACGTGDWRRDCLLPTAGLRQRGEGSWNVAWDSRPARWTHHLDLVCLLLGVCSSLAPLDWSNFLKSQASESEPASVDVKDREEVVGHQSDGGCVISDGENSCKENSPDYRVTGVVSDGRCLFRALAHGSCLQSGIEAPDENRQTELADELRARVVDELLNRRKEIEWFIEGDFDAYLERIGKPYVWGGEPELIMASHVLKTPIAVYMREKSSGKLSNIANYGEEYEEEKEFPINVLFYGYGHYDILETPSNQSHEKPDV